MKTEKPHIKLSDLTKWIQQTIEERFMMQTFWVIAEISSLSHYAQKNTFYFDLIEKEEASGKIAAQLKAAAFNQAYSEIEQFTLITGQAFQNGIQVLCNVSIGFHPVYGLRANFLQIDTSFTIGQLQKQREATLARLVKENTDAITLLDGRYITRNQLHKLPLVLQRVAVISSQNSAGLQDFLHTIAQNPHHYVIETELFHVNVQGDDNGKQIVTRFLEIFNRISDFDLVVVIRGGGAQTDFLLFDTYPVAKAIARFPIPVFTGLGHLKDVSISDLMAHTALKTPTKVAEFIVEHNRKFEEYLLRYQSRLVIKVQEKMNAHQKMIQQLQTLVVMGTQQKLNERKNRLTQLQNTISRLSLKEVEDAKHQLTIVISGILSRPRQTMQQQKHALQLLQANLTNNAKTQLENRTNALNNFTTLFRLLSPAQTLKRGFAIVKKDAKIITNADNIDIGDNITVYLSDSEITSYVTKKQQSTERGFDL